MLDTQSRVQSYHDKGFLCTITIMSTHEARLHREALENLEQSDISALPHPLSYYLRQSAHIASDVPLRIARDARVLDQVEAILGPDILLWSCEYFIKEAGSSKIVSWHQDLTYWGMDGSDHEVTAWVALSPARKASGCMKFVPGSHKHTIVPHEDTFSADNLLSRGQEIAVEVNEDDAIHAELQPGQMSLHHGRLFHASGPNTTDDRRIGLVMRYIRPDTPSTGAQKDYAMLVRGADRLGTRINLCPPPRSLTDAQLRLHAEVLGLQADVLTSGLEGKAGLYDGQDV